MVPAFALAMLGGVFFILVGLYWILVCWWVKASGGRASKKVSFSFLTALWFILALLLVGTAAALATEVFEHRHTLASWNKDTPCNGTNDDNFEPDDVPKVPYHYNIIPVLALASMVILWVVHVCVFFVHVVCPKK